MPRFNSLASFSLSILAGVILSGAVYASSDKAGTVATVNGIAIPKADMDFILSRQLQQGAKDTPEVRNGIRDFLVAQQVVAQEASKEGLDKSADFQVEARFKHMDMLRDMLFDQYIKMHPVKATAPADKQKEIRQQIGVLMDALKAKAKVVDRPNAVAEVNGVVIAKSDADFIVRHEIEQGNKDTPELRAKLREFLVAQQIFAQEAIHQGLDKTPDFKIADKFTRMDVLRNELFAHFIKANPITPAAMKAEYDKRVATMPKENEYHAHHILVKTESEANEVLAALKSGQAFDAVAKAKSTDVGSKDSGGDLGWNAPEKFVKEFSTAMVALKKGQTTTSPVKSQYGYHIIRLDDMRPLSAPSYEQVKGRLEQFMQREQIEKFVAGLKSKAKVS